MRIGIDIINLASGAISGVEQYTLQILKEMIRQNPQDQFVLFALDYYFRGLGDRLDRVLRTSGKFLLEAPNVTLKKLSWPKIPLSLHLFWKVFDWPKADWFLGGADLFFQPAPMLLPLSRRVPRVVTFHDLAPAIYPEYFTLTSRLWHWQMNYPARAREANRIIAVSESTKNDLVRLYGVDPEKIHVIYEGASEAFDKAMTSGELERVRQKFKLPQKFLFYLGSLEPRKNVLSVIRALKYLKGQGFVKIKLVIAGSKKWLETPVFEEIRSSGLGGEVIFLGFVPEEEKAALFKLALAFIFPSFYEGFGLPVLEALRSNCPVVASQASSLPEIVQDSALLVDPYSQDSINQAVLALVKDSALRGKLCSLGRKQASRFSWAKAAQETMRVLRETKSL